MLSTSGRSSLGHLRPFRSALLIGAMASALGLGLSCSTTQGSAYSSSVSQDASTAAEAKRRADEKHSPSNQSPSPAAPSQVNPGQASRPDSYPRDGGDLAAQLFMSAVRAATSGAIRVSGMPAGTRLYVDGQASDASSLILPMGLHSVSATGFGYLPWSSSVEVFMGRTTEVTVNMGRSPFSLGGVRASPPLFDPSMPGALGRTRLSFTATGPGRASVAVFSTEGRLVREVSDIAINSKESVVEWDGRGGDGKDLPSGEYRIRVRATGSEGSSLEAQGFVRVASTHAQTSHSSIASGFGGAFYAPDARILPAGRTDASMGAYAVLDPEDSGAARLPVFGGLRFGLPGDKTEVAVSGMGVFYPGYDFSADSGLVSATLKTSLSSDETWAWALLFGANAGSYFSVAAPSSWDGPARFPGVSAGLAVESDSSIARAFGSAQLEASDYYPGYGYGEGYPELPGFFAWVYLRGGLEFVLPDFLGCEATLSLSAAGRSAPFSRGLSFELPLSMGAELQCYLPGSPLILSAYASGEWASRSSFYLGGGLGLGFVL